MTSRNRPQVVTDPGIRWGQPNVGGISVEAIAGAVWSGQGVAVTADDYDLTSPQVLVACWYAGRFGTWRDRKGAQWCRLWGEWAAAVETRLAAGDYDIPDPPTMGGER